MTPRPVQSRDKLPRSLRQYVVMDVSLSVRAKSCWETVNKKVSETVGNDRFEVFE